MPKYLIASLPSYGIYLIMCGGRTGAFLLRSGQRQGYPLWPLLINTVIKVLSKAIRKKRKQKMN